MRRFTPLLLVTLPALASLNVATARAAADSIDLTRAVVVIRSGTLPTAEKIAPVILTEELAKRTGISWSVSDRWPKGKQAVIALSIVSSPPAWKQHVPAMGEVGHGKPEGLAFACSPRQAASPTGCSSREAIRGA